MARSIPVAIGIAGVVLALFVLGRLLAGPHPAPAVAPAPGEASGPFTSQVTTGATDPASPDRRDAAPTGPLPEALSTAKPLIRFEFDGAGPAASLSIRSAGPVTATSAPAFVPCSGDWPARLGMSGEIVGEKLRALGPIFVVRLSDCAVQLVAFQEDTVTYRLEPLISQQFRLEIPENDDSFFVEMRLSSESLGKYWNSTEAIHDRTAGPILDKYCVQTSSLVDPATIACCTIRLESRATAVEIRVPQGRYFVQSLSCTFGWAMQPLTVIPSAEPIQVPVYRVPIARTYLGGVDAPKPERVVLLEKTAKPGSAASSGERALPIRVGPDYVETAITVRPEDSQYSTYALKFYWADGTERVTPDGPWESVLQVREIGN